MTAKKLWIWLGATVAASFLVLIFFGVEIYRTAPPFPEKIVTTDGETLYEGQDIKDGQNAWQSMGGQTVGSIWGTELTSLPTGTPITFTASLCSY